MALTDSPTADIRSKLEQVEIDPAASPNLSKLSQKMDSARITGSPAQTTPGLTAPPSVRPMAPPVVAFPAPNPHLASPVPPTQNENQKTLPDLATMTQENLDAYISNLNPFNEAPQKGLGSAGPVIKKVKTGTSQEQADSILWIDPALRAQMIPFPEGLNIDLRTKELQYDSSVNKNDTSASANTLQSIDALVTNILEQGARVEVLGFKSLLQPATQAFRDDFPTYSKYLFAENNRALEGDPLPFPPHEIEHLSKLMARTTLERWSTTKIDSRKEVNWAPISPKTHPYHPYWLPGHPSNVLIDKVLSRIDVATHAPSPDEARSIIPDPELTNLLNSSPFPNTLLPPHLQQYSHFFTASGYQLASSPLPKDPAAREELCKHMADHILARYLRFGKGVIPAFAPLEHEFYPKWLADHTSGDVVARHYRIMKPGEKVFGRGRKKVEGKVVEKVWIRTESGIFRCLPKVEVEERDTIVSKGNKGTKGEGKTAVRLGDEGMKEKEDEEMDDVFL
ncbi:hypothetical protein BDV96DRAFT_644495 [Lophiotrema nucula]|uniref:Uncharacterized protein n=1 Tax=Lophiotrema nucula TaxID=690887 RepID=A0A6A5ZC62_9PLEO|nr:hypothetical protein BDV96DRAFT_644495 [Lophiotrema nucula]